MRTLLSLRLTRPGIKFIYVLAVLTIGMPAWWVIPSVPVLDVVIGGLGLLTSFAGFWYGTRVFRGRGEAVTPARPWWRWTAWPALSWVLGIVITLQALGAGLQLAFNERFRPPDAAAAIQLDVAVAVLAVFGLGYLNSAFRLTFMGARKPLKDRSLLRPPKLG